MGSILSVFHAVYARHLVDLAVVMRTIDDVLNRLRADFLEMPGLRISAPFPGLIEDDVRGSPLRTAVSDSSDIRNIRTQPVADTPARQKVCKRSALLLRTH